MIGKRLLKKLKVAHAVWCDNWRYSGNYAREGAIKKARIPLFFDMLYSELTTGSDPHNYFMFYFESQSQQERRRWITNHINAHTAARHSGKEIWNLFEDKAKFNERFKDFVKRRWLDTRSSSSERITEFVQSLGKVIVKPLNMSAGEGIFLLQADDNDKTAQLLSDIQKGHHCLLEEVKENVAELKALNPTSLNTIRVVTCLNSKGELHFLCTVLRMGSTDSCIDNSIGGGVTSYIDIKTGRLCSPAIDRKRQSFERHPRTGIELIGYQIPNWDDVLEFVRKAAYVEPRAHYVGWDIALCPDGIELIEGNIPPGEGIIQACDQKPKRQLLEEYLK